MIAQRLSQFFSGLLDAAWVIELLLNVLAWVILCWNGKKKKVLIPASIGLFLVQAAGGIGLFGLIGMNNAYPLLFKLLKGAVSYLFLCLFSGYQRRTRILIHIALFNAMQSISALAGQCSYIMGSLVQSGAPEGVIRCVVEVLIPLTALFLRQYDFDKFDTVPSYCTQLELTFCGGILVVGVAECCLRVGSTSVTFAFMSAYFSLVVTSLVMIRAVYTMCREQKDIIDLQAEKQRFLAEREITQMAHKSLNDLRCIRHDLKNQYAYMQILLSEKRYEELDDYFQKFQENMPAQLNLIDCGNHTVNTVLNMEFSKFRAEQIQVEHQLVVPPTLPFPDGEICSVLTNLLDNAYDECRRLLKDGWQSAKVRIEIYPHQSYLYLRCMNSTDRTGLEHLGTGLLTTKRDKQLHGYGTRIIAKIAEKYNGCAQYQLENEMFVAQVMMDMTWEEANHENKNCPL